MDWLRAHSHTGLGVHDLQPLHGWCSLPVHWNPLSCQGQEPMTPPQPPMKSSDCLKWIQTSWKLMTGLGWRGSI